MARDYILHKARTALGRTVAAPVEPPPAARIRVPQMDEEGRITLFARRLEDLAAKYYRAPSQTDAREYVASLLAGRPAVASNAPFLDECGITALPGVRSGFTDREALRAACAEAPAGITSADYALADTGTLVMFSSREEPRLVSLLPPLHVAVVPRGRILTGLDELFTLAPKPADQTSSMVLITGPSRTADIEQILVRGVHGPGELHVVVV
jgi:L-lactate dehydrogenase complex protein LldG